jgi:MtN3 and saliva related transmembrane protein
MQVKKIQEEIEHDVREDNPTDQSPKRQRVVAWAEKAMIAIGISGQTLFYFQAYKIYVVGSANDVSALGFSFATLSLLCWLLYGLIIKNKALIVVNAFALIGALLTLLAIFMVS